MKYNLIAALLLSTSALAAPDTATYNFENGIQGWTALENRITTIGVSTTQFKLGTQALGAKFSLPTANINTNQEIFVKVDQALAGYTITFNVYLPSTAKLNHMQPFVQEVAGGNYRWTGNWQPGSALRTSAWNTFSVVVPANASNVDRLGVEFNFRSSFTGTIYVDSVTLVAPQVVVDSGQPPVPDSGTPDAGVPDSGTPDAGPVPDAGTPPPVGSLIPADRLIDWNPGLNPVGGIPNRTTVCATLAPSGGDDTAAIQSRLNTCAANTVIQLGAGVFRISGSGLEIKRDNLTLRGMGPSVTTITRIDTSDFANIVIGNRWRADKLKDSVNLTVDAPKGSNSVSVAQMPLLAYSVGELVRIDQITDPNLSVWSERSPLGDASRGWFSRPNRPMPQVLEIASVTGNTLTFTTKLHADYVVALNAQISRYGVTYETGYTPVVKYSGVEDMTVELGRGGDGGGNIHFFVSAYSWVKNVVSTKNRGASIALDSAFRCEVRDSYIHTTLDPNPGGSGYLLSFSQGSADNLIENNVIWNGNKVIVMRSTGGGNVIGYNYMQDAYGAGYPDWVETGINATHMTTAHYELFEGNESFSLGADDTWGNSVYIVAFRNSFTGLRRSAAPLVLRDIGQRQPVGLTRGSYYYTVIGNVLGFPNMPLASGQTSFTYEESQNLTNAVVPMWRLGYNGGSGSQPTDPRVKATLLRTSNYDYFTNSIRDGQANLPNSLYLTSKPAFFGTNTWPWIDPAGSSDSERVKTLPAKVRFNSLHP